MVLSTQELFAIEKMATAGMGNKHIGTTLGLPQSTMKRWLQRLRYTTAFHATVEFQLLCSPDLSPSGFFLRNELKTQLVQHPVPANPAEVRALLTRVYLRTWTGSRWKHGMGSAG